MEKLGRSNSDTCTARKQEGSESRRSFVRPDRGGLDAFNIPKAGAKADGFLHKAPYDA